MKFLIITFVMLFSLNANDFKAKFNAEIKDNNYLKKYIEYFTLERMVKFVATHDPLIIEVELENGKIIELTGKKWINYREINKNEVMIYGWNEKYGIYLTSINKNLTIILEPYYNENHPIELAYQNCGAFNTTTFGQECHQLKNIVLDIEINRLYEILVSKYDSLKISNDAWNKFLSMSAKSDLEVLSGRYDWRNYFWSEFIKKEAYLNVLSVYYEKYDYPEND